jgi:hypothetical protein
MVLRDWRHCLKTVKWSKADLHLHSICSDGADTVRSIVEHIASQTDLCVAALTDHDRIDGSFAAQQLAPRYGFEMVVGQEVTTRRGHLLALYIEERVPPGLSIPETVAAVHEQGGIAVLAHPFDRICNSPMRHRPRPKLAEWIGFRLDGLEGINGCQLDPASNPRAEALGALLGLTMTGGSDAHHKEAIGVAFTLFPGETAEDLRQALALGECRPAGRRWSAAQYLAWASKSLFPRTWRSVWPWARPAWGATEAS